MKFTIAHNNITVLDLEKSLSFYKEALDLDIQKAIEPEDGSFKIVYLTDGSSVHKLELTWYRDKAEPWNLGDNEIHTAFIVDDFDAELNGKTAEILMTRFVRFCLNLSGRK